jgi:hypothetical protein
VAHLGKVTLVNFCECHPCYLLRHQEGPSAPRPPAAGAGPATGASARPRHGCRPASPDGWRPWREARGPRSAPQDPSGSGSSSPLVIPSPSAPSSSGIRRRVARRASRCGQGLWLRGLGGSVRCRAGRRPIRRAMGVCSTGCAWFRRHTPRPRAFHPGPRGAASLGACPQQTRPPRPHPSPLGGPVHGSCPEPGAGKRRARQVRRSNHLAGSSSGHNE